MAEEDQPDEAHVDLVVELLRDFPHWAVWLPWRRRGWTAVRPASSRPPSADLPMIWAYAVTARELRRKIQAIEDRIRDPELG
jgi:hypothetical protein